MIIVLTILAIAAFSYELVYSDLSNYIKSFLWLDEEKPQIILLSKWLTYKRLLGRSVFIFAPIVLLMIILSNLHRFLFNLLLCAYCTSVWIGLLASFLLGYNFTLCLIVAFSANFATALYSRLRA